MRKALTIIIIPFVLIGYFVIKKIGDYKTAWEIRKFYRKGQ